MLLTSSKHLPLSSSNVLSNSSSENSFHYGLKNSRNFEQQNGPPPISQLNPNSEVKFSQIFSRQDWPRPISVTLKAGFKWQMLKGTSLIPRTYISSVL